MKKRICFGILFIGILLIGLTGCYSGREINTLGIAVAIGIDKSDNGYLVTYQLLNPKAIASKKTGSSAAPIILYTETGKDMFVIKRRITEQAPRKIYNSHLRLIVFSEEVAREGIEKFIDFFARGHEYRTDFYFLVAKGNTANQVLRTVTPLEEVSGLEVYSSLETSEKNWAPTKSTKIYELVNQIVSDGLNPVLTGVEIVDRKGSSGSVDALKQSEPAKLKLFGLSAFQKDRLVGWLAEDESKGYNYITDNVNDTVGFVQYDEQNILSFEVIKSKSSIKVTLQDNKPAVEVLVRVKANLSSETGLLDVSDEEVVGKITPIMEQKTEQFCNKAIKKAKNDLKTDIFGFGEAIHRSYPQIWKTMKDNWNEEFTELPVTVKAKVEINNIGENNKTVLSKGNS